MRDTTSKFNPLSVGCFWNKIVAVTIKTFAQRPYDVYIRYKKGYLLMSFHVLVFEGVILIRFILTRFIFCLNVVTETTVKL